MSTDDFKDLASLHGRDLAYYHDKKCEGEIVLEATNKTMRSWCPDCEMLLVSTLATVGIQRSRDGKNE